MKSKIPEERIEAVIVELDYKANYERFALTLAEFEKEYGERLAEGMPWPENEAISFTLRPMVHIWYQKVIVGDESWMTFFTDMEHGLPEEDVKSRNLARIVFSQMEELKDYVPKALYEFYCPADGALYNSLAYLLTVERETDKMYYGSVRLVNSATRIDSFAVRKDNINKVVYRRRHNEYKVHVMADSYTDARMAASELIYDHIINEAKSYLAYEKKLFNAAVCAE